MTGIEAKRHAKTFAATYAPFTAEAMLDERHAEMSYLLVRSGEVTPYGPATSAYYTIEAWQRQYNSWKRNRDEVTA